MRISNVQKPQIRNLYNHMEGPHLSETEKESVITLESMIEMGWKG